MDLNDSADPRHHGRMDGEENFVTQHSALERWPYSLNLIEETLDSKLIEGRGKQLLFRALNAGTVVAFIGTGMSMSYGRLGWKELQDEQTKEVKALAEKFLRCSEAARKLIAARIESLPSPRERTEHAHRIAEGITGMFPGETPTCTS